MNPEKLISFAAAYLRNTPLNLISEAWALEPELVGMRMYDDPLFGFANAQDEYFTRLPGITEANLPMMMTPRQWLPEAKSVISFFVPKAQAVRISNIGGGDPSAPWLHARIEGQTLIIALCKEIAALLQQHGYKAVIPAVDPRFKSAGGEYSQELCGTYTSLWSERHAAYACGLGTFGLSKGLITKKGVAGRFGSIITDLSLPATPPPPGQGVYDSCTFCGACALRCPAGAITVDEGKNHVKCDAYLDIMRDRYRPRYGCGKCQVGVPCESRVPKRR